jgi:hypothetical protein
MTEVEFINRWLRDQEKKLNGEPTYRLVWSDKETEVRLGTFNDFTPSGLFIRTVTEAREVLKYPFIKERWILEKYIPPEMAANAEIPSTMFGSYEPLYVFENAAGEYLKPTLKVVEFIINVKRQRLDRMTPAERKEFFEKQDQQAVQATYDSLGDSTVLASQFHNREAIIVPSTYEREKNAN